MDELKPCPFCGGKADTFGRDWGKWWGVERMACQGFVGGLKTPEEARQVWNLRVGDVLDELCDQCYGHLVQGCVWWWRYWLIGFGMPGRRGLPRRTMCWMR